MPDDDMEVLVYTEADLIWMASHDSDCGGWKESSISGPLITGVTHWMDVIPPTKPQQPNPYTLKGLPMENAMPMKVTANDNDDF